MANASATVDVVIPVYNAEATIDAALRSVLDQSLSDIRIIVIDDGSTDTSANIIQRHADADLRIVFLQQSNAGVEAARNSALPHCTSDFIACFDADDLCAPDRLKLQVEYLRSHPACVAVDGWHWQIDAAGEQMAPHRPAPGPVAYDPTRLPALEPYLTHTFMTLRRDAMQAVNGYRSAFRAQDADLCWRLLDRGELHHTSIDVGAYRFHAQSISSISSISGRVSAVSSQLVALSFQRRRSGLTDIVFDPADIGTYSAAESIESMTRLACNQLTPQEVSHFRQAVAAKLVQLATYRLFRLDAGDLTFIRRELMPTRVSVRHWRDVAKLRFRLARKLFRTGRRKDALRALI